MYTCKVARMVPEKVMLKWNELSSEVTSKLSCKFTMSKDLAT